MTHKYKLRYTINFENGDFESTEVVEGQGLADALLLVSILKPIDGSYSQLLLHQDGATGKELTQKDLFKVWLTMGLLLSDNKCLKGWQRELIDSVAKSVRDFIKNASLNKEIVE